jgi:hypothetical protein
MDKKEVADEITRHYNEWISEQHATEYLSRANDIPHEKKENLCFLIIYLFCKTYFRSWNGGWKIIKAA